METSKGSRLRKLESERGVVLTVLYLIMAVIAVILGTFYGFAWSEHQGSLRYEQGAQAFFLAEAAIDQKITEIEQGNLQDIPNAPLGRGAFTADYDAANSMLTGTAAVSDSTRSIVTTLQQTSNFQAVAAVAVQGIAETGGTLTVDGRDHDLNGNLTGGAGVFGISTTQAQTVQRGASTVGGNGFAPANPANPGAVQLLAPALPTTPEAVLGLPPGALNRFRTNQVPRQFSGIVYLTASVNSVDLGTAQNPGRGILIVHNDTNSAELKNIRGVFEGLIISDALLHVHATLLGAVAALQQPGQGQANQLGNGSGQILYSSQALSNLPLNNVTPTTWRDLQNDPDPQTPAITYQ